jgi:hypothetical protein
VLRPHPRRLLLRRLGPQRLTTGRARSQRLPTGWPHERIDLGHRHGFVTTMELRELAAALYVDPLRVRFDTVHVSVS